MKITLLGTAFAMFVVAVALQPFQLGGVGSAAASTAQSWRKFRATPTPAVRGPNVVLVSIDTLRADHMSLHGYHRPTTPCIDAFAARARVFDNACSTTPFTAPSVVSILTGQYPRSHGVRLLWQKIEDSSITVADHLHRAGYETAAVVSNWVLTDVASGLASRFDHYDEQVDEPESNRTEMLERRASRTTDAALTWLSRRSDTRRPFFLWVHYIDPHGPYRPPADAPRRFDHDKPHPIDPEALPEYVRQPGVTDGASYVDRYDEEIAYADREVGRLLAALDAAGVSEDALIILTADHGEYLLEREDVLFCHGYGVDRAVTHVPLLVRHPAVEPGRESQPVSIADVTPTILDLSGLPVPEGLDGRSLRAGPSSRPPHIEGPDPLGSGGLERAFVFPNRKVVVRHGRSNEPREAWAFDLAVDPAERKRLAVDPAEPGYLVLAEWIRTDPDPGGRPAEYVHGDKPSAMLPSDLGDDALEKLRSLGYVN